MKKQEGDTMEISKKESATAQIYTHADLENFPDDEVWELIEGMPYQHDETNSNPKIKVGIFDDLRINFDLVFPAQS
jgi:hypothetical protein